MYAVRKELQSSLENASFWNDNYAQLSTLLLTEDNYLQFYKLLSRVEVHVMSNSYWLIIRLFLITCLLGLVQVTKLCSFLFELGSQTGNYPPPPSAYFLPPAFCFLAIL